MRPGGVVATVGRIHSAVGDRCSGDRWPGGPDPAHRELPGLSHRISGGELAGRAVLQAERFGARRTVPVEVVGLDRGGGGYPLWCAGGEHRPRPESNVEEESC
jgi:hypothetical protein